MKLFFSELIYSCLGNINSNFDSISFEVLENGGVSIRFIFSKLEENEKELVQEIVEEFEARHGVLEDLKWESLLSKTKPNTLENILYMNKKKETKQVIYQKSYSYSFFKDSDEYFLNVVVGGAAMFDFTFKINANEIKEYQKKGKQYVEQLVSKIQANHKPYFKRKIN